MDTSITRDQITLDAVFAAAWRRRWLMLACVVLATGLATAAAFVMKPKYLVEVVMIPVKADDARSALSSVVGQLETSRRSAFAHGGGAVGLVERAQGEHQTPAQPGGEVLAHVW